MRRIDQSRGCAWCGEGLPTGPDRVATLSHDVCDYCLIGLIVLVSGPVFDPGDPEAADALGEVLDACG